MPSLFTKKIVWIPLGIIILFILLALAMNTPEVPETEEPPAPVVEREELQETEQLTEEIILPEEVEGEIYLVTEVIDGGTIEIEGGQRVRYLGIDAPEIRPRPECFWKQAVNANKSFVENKKVKLEKDVSDTDEDGRLLRYVRVGNIFMNDYLVRNGYARVSIYSPDVKYSEQLLQAEQVAKENNRGLWASCPVAP